MSIYASVCFVLDRASRSAQPTCTPRQRNRNIEAETETETDGDRKWYVMDEE